MTPELDEILQRARQLALSRLAVREYSEKEMLDYLKRKSIPAEQASETVTTLVSERLLDNQRFVKTLARSQALRERGPGYILNQLRQKGIHIEMPQMREIFTEVSGQTELAVARKIVERRYANAPHDPTSLKRAYEALLRRGFSAEVARQALWNRPPSMED
ncbi:regulatory protein RecX [Bdellovibrionota bacterium FG-1]